MDFELKKRAMEKRKAPKRVVGVVSSDKMDKTIAVEVERLRKQPKYKKYMKRTSRFKAHDACNEAHEGDLVEIEFTRPLSKTKCWRLVRILRRAHGALQEQQAEPGSAQQTQEPASESN